METVLPRRRKSQGSIRSPVVKRDSQSQVVLEGWLYKLEGGALRQWKNRWCVLADFCLFFYKGRDEDKVFSSVLLPSYKISLCCSEDKISRKFAFKAEHQNMKTYYFAADSKETMNKWMSAMSLACVMQKFGRGDNFENCPLSSANDDEDSGFTSYQSRRYGSQGPNSTLDGSFTSEPLNQRCSSYGDRVGEMLLGSDDKYPNVYDSNQSHLYKALSVDNDVPHRQPLYANAPPKPRRLTQSDVYAIAPSEQYGSMGYDNLAPDLSNSHYQGSLDYQSQYPKANTNIPQEVSGTCYNMYSPHSSNIEHSYESQNVSKVVEQPPRPHSADFLERDTECLSVAYRNVGGKTQPQRPKSSLECYDRFWESEECGFEDYREAVRSQADSLYTNRKKQHSELRTDKGQKETPTTVQRKNVYNNSSTVLTERKDTQLGQLDYNENECKNDSRHVFDKHYSSKPESHLSPEKKSKTHEESMKRLIEWKQRMLQSPLTKRSQQQSTAQNADSSGKPPTRPPLPSEYRQQVLQELESHEARLRMHEHEVSRGRSKSWHDPSSRSVFPDAFHERETCDSKGNSSFELGKYTPDSCPPAGGSSTTTVETRAECEDVSEMYKLGDEMWSKAENDKVMYCVDSDNNEILISYKAEDSPVASSVPFIVDNSYMNKEHGLNKSASSNEVSSFSSYHHQGKQPLTKYSIERDLSESVNPSNVSTQRSENAIEFPSAGPCSHIPHHYNTSYSSDDEDMKEGSHSRRYTQTFKPQKDKEDGKTTQASKENFEILTPDYVNINFVKKKWQKNNVKEACIKSIPAENDLSGIGKDEELDTNQKASRTELSFYDGQNDILHSIPDDLKTGFVRERLDSYQNSSHSVYEEEKQLDIKREDYYRASQLFYSLPQLKNEKGSIPVSPDRGLRRNEPSLLSKSLLSPSTARHIAETYDSRYRKNVINPGTWNLDKDVGLPLPVVSGKVHPKRYSELSLDHARLQCPQIDSSTNSYDKSPIPDNSAMADVKDISADTASQLGYRVNDIDCSKDNYKNFSEKSSSSLSSEKEKWKNPASFANLTSAKKNVSSEEMRLLLRQQREAPPPNIVQERIKRFESVENNSNIKIDKGDVGSSTVQDDFLKPKLDENLDHKDGSQGQVRCDVTRKKIRHKTSHYHKFQRRNMHSDSEAAWPHDSDDTLSDDSLTMKSAPILLSPLSSVLADLRKTADTGKEKTKPACKTFAGNSVTSENEVSPPVLVGQDFAINSEVVDPCAKPNRLDLINKSLPNSEFHVAKRKLDFEEEAYLPMSGLKTSEEPEYVAMDDSRLGLSRSSHEALTKKASTEDEPLYNEPYLPPPSFLHDVYEKQKMKHIQFESDSSSSDELSENIYEKPKHLPSSVLEYNKVHKSINRENTGNKSNSFLSNNLRTLAGNNPDHPSGRVSVPCDYESLSENAQPQYNYPTLQSHSVPDLLQLQEIKYSDASDADDEASRDFDMSMNLPSYQCEAVSDSFQIATDDSTSHSHHKYPSFDSDASFAHKQVLDHNDADRGTQHLYFPLYSHTPLSTSEFLGLPPPLNSSLKDSADDHAYGLSENVQPETFEEEKQIHFRKLRVYTKGKKPEAPKIYPVPFNMEESELHVPNLQSKCDVTDVSQGNSLAVDVVKTSDKNNILNYNSEIFMDENSHPSLESSNLNRPAGSNIPHMVSSLSLAPDVVPSDLIEEKLKNQKIFHSPCRSPNSAPYYYSDLHPESSHLFSPGRNENSDFRRSASPKNTCAVLNNVREKSPSYICKGDIGKRVNKINSKKPMHDCRDVCNENPLKYQKEVAVDLKSDFKHTIEKLNCSESKYLDAERNKYEAGHTLDKTRRACSSLAFFRQGASTPDLKSPLNHSSEPVYENITRESSHLVRQRSCSLEGLSTNSEYHNRFGNSVMPETSTAHYTTDGKSSPIYENIEFASHSCDFPIVSDSAPRHIVQTLNFTPPFAENCSSKGLTGSASTSCHRQISDEKSDSQPDPNHNRIPVSAQNAETNAVHPKDTEEDAHCLGQYELRRVSEQHFFGRLYNNSRLFHPSVQYEKYSSSSYLPPAEENQHTSGKDFLRDNLNVQGKIHPNSVSTVSKIDTQLRDISEVLPRQDDEAASSSLSSSSGEEASGDSEHRCKRSSLRTKSSLHRTLNASDSEIHVKEPNQLRKLVQHSEGLTSKGKRLSISAGDLLGKTHEELVLLLIQLRRNQSRISRAKEKCQRQLENEQQLQKTDQVCSPNASELMKQITQLEKQYEVTRPLVNLVDNMVKLGSLYGTCDNGNSFPQPDDLVAEALPIHFQGSEKLPETSIWSGFSQDESDLRGHLNEIYNLDKGLRQESHSFSSLQQDKEMLEFTLNGMKSKILDHQDKPIELQRLRKQQKMIEKELSRVKRLLSHSAKKIEEATTKNDQLEQEILCLRQKIQQALKTGSCEMETCLQSRADLEAELTRVQTVLEELANHRQEINNTVEKLRNEAHLKVSLHSAEVRASPTGVAGSAPLPLRKKQQSSYLETDLDTMVTRDLSTVVPCLDDIPVYVNAEEISANQGKTLAETDCPPEYPPPPLPQNTSSVDSSQCSLQDINDADDRMKRFYGILPREKSSEIKTVRIVKRQSERRNRERDKKRVTYDEQSLVWVSEEPDISSDDFIEAEDDSFKKAMPVTSSCSRPTSIPLPQDSVYKPSSAHERLFGKSTDKAGKVTDIPVSSENRSPTKRWKRRHYTVSGYQCMFDPQFSPSSQDRPRSRDDVDMERCLRTANTPDIVRSTIKKKEVFDEKIIDRELGLPQKIVIPERYIEDEPEQLSASERLRRSLKAENIRKMLSETTTIEDISEGSGVQPDKIHKKLNEEKRKRAHLLALNHALAREVMERSKVVAVVATLEHLGSSFLKAESVTPIEEDLSPMIPLPITQQRYNFLC